MVEQINQTWTYLGSAGRREAVAEAASGSRRLPAGTWAYAANPLDIMSGVEGLVGAETFAAVDPRNNDKLEKDLTKMAERTERHRYIFFMSPKFPGAQRLPQFERDGVQGWSVDV